MGWERWDADEDQDEVKERMKEKLIFEWRGIITQTILQSNDSEDYNKTNSTWFRWWRGSEESAFDSARRNWSLEDWSRTKGGKK